MPNEAILYTDLEDENENYVDLFDRFEVKVTPYPITWKEYLIFAVAFIVLTAIGIGIITEEPPEETKDYILFGIFSLMYLGIFGGLAWHLLKPQADYYFNDQGVRAGLRGTPIPWAKVKDIAIDFLGMKIYETNGKKHRIFIQDADDQYRLNVFLSNLAWLHKKHPLSSSGLVRGLLQHLEKGMNFGKEQANVVRQREINFYLGVLGLTVFGAVCAGLMIYFYDWVENGELGYSSKKTVIVFGFALIVDLFLLFQAFRNDAHKHAQNITANAKGLDITYADGRQQNVTWQKVLDLWDDPDYGKDGKLHYEIWHSTDGGMLLIHLLPFAADYFTQNPETPETA